MAEEQPTTPSTPTATQPLGNDQSTRAPDGTQKDLQAPVTEPTKAETPPTEPAKVEAKPEAAPTTYADFKAPEGFEIDKAVLDKFVPLFKEMNLSQDQAQKLVDNYVDVTKAAADQPYQAYESLRGEWRDSVIKDPALGDGKADLKPEVKAVIGRAIDSLQPEVAKEFREALILTGAGDNPAFVKAFYALASQLGEGTLVKGGGPSPAGQANPAQPRSAASVLFPNLPSSSR